MMDDRFSDKLPDRYYYRKLPDAAQGRGESAEELGGLYSKLCQRAVWKVQGEVQRIINPLNPELNPICYLLALLGANHFLHVSRIMAKSLTLRLLMSYIYIWSAYS